MAVGLGMLNLVPSSLFLYEKRLRVGNDTHLTSWGDLALGVGKWFLGALTDTQVSTYQHLRYRYLAPGYSCQTDKGEAYLLPNSKDKDEVESLEKFTFHVEKQIWN